LTYPVQVQFIYNSPSNSADRRNKQQTNQGKNIYGTLRGTGETDIHYTLKD